MIKSHKENNGHKNEKKYHPEDLNWVQVPRIQEEIGLGLPQATKAGKKFNKKGTFLKVVTMIWRSCR